MPYNLASGIAACKAAGLEVGKAALTSQMLFAGEAMAPAITCERRAGADSDSCSSGGGGGGGGAMEPIYTNLLLRDLRYPELEWEANADGSHEHPCPWFARRAHVGDVVVWRLRLTHPRLTTG
jgi:hypothetical protein